MIINPSKGGTAMRLGFLFAMLFCPVFAFAQNRTLDINKAFSVNHEKSAKPDHPFGLINPNPFSVERVEIKIKLPWGLSLSKTKYYRTGINTEIWRTSPSPRLSRNQGSYLEINKNWAFGGGLTRDRVRFVSGPEQKKKTGFVFSLRLQF